MKEINITIVKLNVYEEVARTTSYVGAKMLTEQDPGAYERIFATDADRGQLERFWAEVCNIVTGLVKPFVLELSEQGDPHGVELGRNYMLRLGMPQRFDERMQGAIIDGLHSFFVEMITAKWFRFANKGEAEAYAHSAEAMLKDVERKLYWRKKPARITPEED